MTRSDAPATRPWWWAGAVAGGVGLALSQVAAVLLGERDSPVVAVAEQIVHLTPGPLASAAIALLGHADKVALIAAIVVVVVALAAGLGRLRRWAAWPAWLGYAALAAVGLLAVVAQEGAVGEALLPLVVGVVGWLGTLEGLVLLLRDGRGHGEGPGGRRTFLLVSVGLAVAAVAGTAAAAVVSGRRRAVEHARQLLNLDGVTLPDPPVGADLDTPGATPWQTPTEDFYRIDTAFSPPVIDPEQWRLRIHGMVERELEVSFADLLRRQRTEAWVTLSCVSNEVGGDLVGNAWWSGVRIAPLLAEAGVRPEADGVLQTSEDGWTCLTPLEVLTDDRMALLAVAMNGEPLPIEHGFPVRMVVPGLYGYVSATKWLVDLEVTRFDQAQGYWTDKGWSAEGPVRLSSRIDVPRTDARVEAGAVVVAGVAWQPHTGIAGVEVALDGGPWQPARLAEVPGVDTWVQWRASVEAAAGEHRVRVRAVSRSGEVQTGAERTPAPDGATGWHEVAFTAY